MKVIAKIQAFFIVTFVLFAAVQYNDPDPFLWIAAYGFCAALGIVSTFSRISISWLCLVGAVSYGAAGFLMLPDPDVSWMALEEGREAMGLCVCAFGLVVLAYINRIKYHGLQIGKSVGHD